MKLLNIRGKLRRPCIPSQLRAPPAAGPAIVNPWLIKHRKHRLTLTNQSKERLLGVRVSVAGLAVCGVSLPQTVAPGQSLSVWLYEPEVMCASAVAVVQWRNSFGVELLCPVPVT